MTEKDGSLRPRRTTALDVARRAGVSRSAVSRAFSKTAYIDAGKRAHVLRVADEMGYRPNAMAAGLMNTRSNLVAIIAGDVGNFYDAQLVGRLVSVLTCAGKLPILLDHGIAPDALGGGDVFSYPLDAMIVRGGSVDTTVVEACAKLSIPLVFCGCVVEAEHVDSICCRNADGMAMVVDLLLRRGRRRLAYIGGPSEWSSERDRLTGVRDALKRAGLELVAREQADYTFEGGAAAARRLLDGGRFDAILCANDAMALGALTTARQDFGLDVPGELSITGFDDIQMATWPSFSLTTVRNPIEETVRKILDLLTARIETPQRPGQVVLVEPELITRATH